MNKIYLSSDVLTKKTSLNHFLLIMRTAVILLFTCVFISVAETGRSQNAKVSLNKNNVNLKEVLNEIENQTDYLFIYNNEVNTNKTVSVKTKNGTVKTVLAHVLKDSDIDFSMEGNHIILSFIEKQLNEKNEENIETAQQQGKTITGKVVDAQGEAIIGANVIEKGTTNGTITDFDGNFTLQVADDAVLRISYIGYLEQENATQGRNSFNITLIEDTKALDEVIVIGYGTMRKSDLTGAVSSIKADEIQQTPMTSIDQGLGGRASGVLVTQTSGMPGAVASIRVRGSSSLQGGNEPLYVIDGFPVYSGGGYGETGGNSQMSGLSTVNPSDIESIEILKDASATAIYGARAANGVVLITTKSGKIGQDNVSFEASLGISNVVKKLDVMGAQDYASLVNEAYTNDGFKPFYDASRLAEISKLGKGTDWQDEIFKTGITQNYQLTFSGGDEKTTYSVSGNYLNQKGIVIASEFTRYSTRINLDRKISKTFTIGSHINASHTDNDAVQTDVGGEGGVITGALQMNPIQPVYEDELTGKYTQVNTPGLLIKNPVATAKERVYNNNTSRFLGDFYMNWEIVPNLNFKTSGGADVLYNKMNHYTPSTIYESGGRATASVGVNKTINWLNENILTWNKVFAEDHVFNILGGFTLQQNNSEYVRASASDFVNDVMGYNNLGAGSVYNPPSSNARQWNIMSYLARINYSLKDKYLFSVNTRVDGSSRFGENNKYGFFPSASAGWRLSEENFMQSIKEQITNLKLRISYGYTGNTEIGVYQSLATLGSNNVIIGDQLMTGFFPNVIPNPDLKWEKTGQFDIGLDIGLFNNRIRVVTDYYKKKTTDLLYNVAIPSTSGYSSMLKNMGSVENKGYEFSLESDNIITNNFRWTTAFNISTNKSKVIELGGEKYKDVGAGDGHLKTGSFRRLIVGEPIGIFYGYRFDGIFQNEEETNQQTSAPSPIGIGFRRYKDLNADGKIDPNNDREIIGDANPDFFGGITNTLSYKGFELNVFLQYSYGNDIFNYNKYSLEAPTGGQNVYTIMKDRWTPNNPSNIYPKASTNRVMLVSDHFLEDGSYLKLKSVSLSYAFPNLKTKHIQGLQLYITGQNLFTWTSYGGYDPEVSYRGASNLEMGEDFGGYPQSRTIMCGIKLNIK